MLDIYWQKHPEGLLQTVQALLVTKMPYIMKTRLTRSMLLLPSMFLTVKQQPGLQVYLIQQSGQRKKHVMCSVLAWQHFGGKRAQALLLVVLLKKTIVQGFNGFLQDLAGADAAKDPPASNMKDDVEASYANSACHTDNNVVLKDQSRADIYWPDSLGPLVLEMPGS